MYVGIGSMETFCLGITYLFGSVLGLGIIAA